MHNFVFQNPVKVAFGKGQISELNKLIPAKSRILITYGGGSIKQNGVYNQVIQSLAGFNVFEFGGIEPNPEYATLIKAVALCQKEQIDFILAVGGGSVIDGTKFIAAAVNYPDEDKWKILNGGADKITQTIPFAAILTLPATGSEMNSGSVVSRRERGEKLVFMHPSTFPQFAILDPELTYTLPARQLANGIVDPFIHVTEQYITSDLNTPIQDGLAETILRTLIEVAPTISSGEKNYNARANWMWAATNALNGYIGIGVDQDWGTHMIGHELTASYGLDHAQTLAIIAPHLWRYKKAQKYNKLEKFARNVWHITEPNVDSAIEQAIIKTEEFFNQVGNKTKLSGYNIQANNQQIAQNVIKANAGNPLGEHADIAEADIIKILEMAR